MFNSILTIFILVCFLCVYIYYFLNNLGFFCIKYDVAIRKKDFEIIAENVNEVMYSYEISQLIPVEIFQKTQWLKKYNKKGWFDFVVIIEQNKFVEILICDFGNVYLQASRPPLIYIHITILIIKQPKINSEKIKRSILSKKFYSIYKKRSKANIETIENYTFVCFDAPLNLNSLKLLKQCAIEQN